MVDPPPNNEEFYAKALASLNQQMALANNAATVEIESYAKSLVEEDVPKIDSAVKTYLSLVAARSAVASDVDVVTASASTLLGMTQCTFAASGKSPVDVNRCALTCARTLLSTINSTIIPSLAPSADSNEAKNVDEENIVKVKLQEKSTRILWNRLVQQSSGDKAKRLKPSRVLGRDSLLVAYPYIRERLRRGILQDDLGAKESVFQNDNPLRLFSNEALPPVSPPKGIDADEWGSFYTEFGCLLDRACRSSGNYETNLLSQSSTAASEAEDDSALLWSSDGGSSELRRRREARARRAAEASAFAGGDRAVATEAFLGTVPENSPWR